MRFWLVYIYFCTILSAPKVAKGLTIFLSYCRIRKVKIWNGILWKNYGCLFGKLFYISWPTSFRVCAITLDPVEIETWYLLCICIFLKLHILNMTCQGQSLVQGQRSNIHNFWIKRDRDLIFGMHDYLTKPHILGYDKSRSNSSLKVKGHNFWSHIDRQLMFSLQVYLMKPHALSCIIVRSRSFFKVKGQIWS